MTSFINASTSGGLTFTADQSGVLALQTAGNTAVTFTGVNANIVGNITSGNVLTAGLVSATGNITTSANIVASVVNGTSTLALSTGGTSAMTIDASQRILTPSQISFLAYAGVTSVTSGTIPYGGSSLPRNIGSAFNAGTYTFTAPVAGVYSFAWQFFSPPNSAATVDFQINSASVGRYGPESGTITNYCGWSCAMIRYLNASDTARVQYVGGTIHTNASLTYFSGYLLG